MRQLLCVVSILFALAPPGAGSAATFTVNTTLDLPDSAPGNGVCLSQDMSCSLRAAVQEANALAGDDTVVLPAGTYELDSKTGPGEDASSTGDLDIVLGSIVSIEGAGAAVTIVVAGGDGTPEDRIFHVLADGELSLSGVSLRDGVATSMSTDRGGAILNQGTLRLSDCTLDGNDATWGGSIYNDDLAALEVDASTFTNNGASSGGGAVFGDFDSSVDLENSTFHSNDGPDVLRLENVNQFSLTHLTIHENMGKGIVTALSQTLFADIVSSIVSNNSGVECEFSGVMPTRVTSLASDGNCGFAAGGGLDATDPLLGALADNGGSTPTHEPLPGSPAIDAIPLASCVDALGLPVLLDQRGVLRPDGDGGSGNCDIGAVELLPEPEGALLALAGLVAVRGAARMRP